MLVAVEKKIYYSIAIFLVFVIYQKKKCIIFFFFIRKYLLKLLSIIIFVNEKIFIIQLPFFCFSIFLKIKMYFFFHLQIFTKNIEYHYFF